MDDILTIRKVNPLNSPSNIQELLKQISNINSKNNKMFQKLKENELKIAELSKELFTLKQEYEIEKENLESKMYESKEGNLLLNSFKEDNENLELNVRELERRHKTLKKTKPSLRDEQLLESGKRKLKLYKEFTGIRWDYSAPETVVEGYITNKKDFLQKISYKGEIDSKTLREAIWKDIEKSTISTLKSDNCKENNALNN